VDDALALDKQRGSTSERSCFGTFNLATLVSHINTPLRFGCAGVRREAAQRGCWTAVCAQSSRDRSARRACMGDMLTRGR
jgi:hypothetical protein